MPNDEWCFRKNRGGRLLITHHSLSFPPPVRGGMPTAALGKRETAKNDDKNTGHTHTRQPLRQQDPFTHSLTHPIINPAKCMWISMPCTQDKGIPCEVSPAACSKDISMMKLSMVCIICPTYLPHTFKRKTVHPET